MGLVDLVGVGKDYTLWARVDGIVKFERRGKNGSKLSVYPLTAAAQLLRAHFVLACSAREASQRPSSTQRRFHRSLSQTLERPFGREPTAATSC